MLSTADRLAIHELMSLHGHIAADRRSEDLHLLLTSDAVYDMSAYGLGVVAGLEAITRLFVERPGDQPLGHHVTNVMIVPGSDRDSVSVRSKGIAVMANGKTGP